MIAALLEVTDTYLRDQLCRHMSWQKRNLRGSGWRSVDPTRDVAQTILHRAGSWGFKPILGIIQTPVMLADGSILSTSGHDEKTGLMLFQPPPMPAIADVPNKQEAAAALGKLDQLLKEFPFTDMASRSVALSALITPAVRPALPVAPMHVFTSPTPGTGKSYLVDVVSAIYAGSPCPVIGKGESAGELEKRLNASLVAGHSLINIDNVNGDLGGDYLCQAIERPALDIRILGKSEHARIHNNVVLFATGNNLRLVGDVIRRSIVCTLDADVERPELRTFKSSPVADVLSRRGEFIAAALTIVRAHQAARRAGLAGPSQFGSFPDWSDFVRGALIWLGCADPLITMETARDHDPELETLRAALAAIADAFGLGQDNAKTAAHIIATAKSCPELSNALDEIGYKDKPVDPVSLGQWLSRHVGRVLGTKKLVRVPKGKRAAHWYVADLSGQ